MNADRRRFARIEASLACTIATASETVKAQVVNLSRTGVAVICGHSMETGAKITLLIENSTLTVGLTGEIVRKAAIAGELSYGVKFDPLPPQADEELVELLRELAAGKGSGRRAFPRVAARVAVICKTRESFEATLSDLSQGGLKVRCPKPVAENMVLELALGMPGATGLLTLHGDVRHCQAEGAALLGRRQVRPGQRRREKGRDEFARGAVGHRRAAVISRSESDPPIAASLRDAAARKVVGRSATPPVLFPAIACLVTGPWRREARRFSRQIVCARTCRQPEQKKHEESDRRSRIRLPAVRL